jgi:hypothetical protein
MGIIKRGNAVAFKKTTWGTDTEPVTGDQLFVENNSPPTGARELITNAEELSAGLESTLCLGPFEEQSGSFDGKIYVEQTKIMEILASIFGSYGFTADDPVIGVNKHEFVGQKILTADISHTLAYDEGDEVKAVDYMKFMSFVAALDSIYKHTTSYLGNKLEVKTGYTTPLGVTGDDRIACFLNENTTVRINEQTAAALSSGDDQLVTDYGMSLERGLQSEPPTAGTDSISNINDGLQYTFTLTLNYPRKTAQSKIWLPKYQVGQKYKASISMTSGLLYITGTTPYQLDFFFPQLYCMEAPTYDQETPEPVSATFMAQFDANSDAVSMDYKVPYAYWYNSLLTLSGYPAVTET